MNWMNKIMGAWMILMAVWTVQTGISLGSKLRQLEQQDSFCVDTNRRTSIPPAQRLEQRILQEDPSVDNIQEKYGVLISGSSEYRYKENLILAYGGLLSNGFQKENIYVLYDTGERTDFFPVDGSASKENIEKLFSHLGKKIDSRDLLFVYTTGHGDRLDLKRIRGKQIQVSTLSLPGEDLSETEMARYIEGIHLNRGVFVSDQCYGGGFANLFDRKNYIGISASRDDEPSLGNFFPRAFFYSLRDSRADRNRDDKISVGEMFKYALENDPTSRDHSQRPQIFSGIDPETVFLK